MTGTGGQIAGPQLHPFAHRALLYASQDDFLAVAVPFVAQGLERDEYVLSICAPANTQAMKSALGTPAVDVWFVNYDDWWRHPTSAITRTHACMTQLAKTHRGRIRVIEEPLINRRHPGELRELLRGEAAANVVQRFSDAWLVCAFNARGLGSNVTGDIRRTHPELIGPSGISPSADYVDPATFLAEGNLTHTMPSPRGSVAVLDPASPACGREFIETHARAAGLPPAKRAEFVTAVNEILTNAHVHASGGTVRVWRQGNSVICEVQDRGPGLDDALTGYQPPPLGSNGGRGLWLARQLTDLLEVRSDGNGTTVRLHAKL
ncbi:MAG: anti-sigma factor RsbA family regulatory protein [Egibacteraceae bacterium]